MKIFLQNSWHEKSLSNVEIGPTIRFRSLLQFFYWNYSYIRLNNIIKSWHDLEIVHDLFTFRASSLFLELWYWLQEGRPILLYREWQMRNKGLLIFTLGFFCISSFSHSMRIFLLIRNMSSVGFILLRQDQLSVFQFQFQLPLFSPYCPSLSLSIQPTPAAVELFHCGILYSSVILC